MTLTLNLPPDLEARLNAEAARRRVSPAEYALEALTNAIPGAPAVKDDERPELLTDVLNAPWPEDEPRPTNGAELVAYWERHGLIGTRPDITDSVEYVQEMRRKAERRDWS